MSAVISAPRDTSSVANVATAPMEHIHLHMKRTHWETCRHENLGAHLQDALSALDTEGWEVVSVFVIGQTPEVILRRFIRPLDA
ncbi:MAG: hypothetical protein V4671_20660 [Armatimonadota bacterium]